MDEFFKAINDETRRSILELLRKGDLNAGEIADHFSISKPSISHHLDILKRAGLISSTKNGQFLTYTLNTSVFEEFITWILKFKTEKSNESTKIQIIKN